MNMLVSRFLLVPVLLCVPGVLSGTGFVWTRRAVWNNGCWNTFCYDLAEYRPTCGWKLVLKSVVPLNKIDVWDAVPTTTDNYVFTLTNVSFSGDFRNKNMNTTCSNINVFGTFQNSMPDMVITWYCICDDTTSGACKNVPTPVVSNSLTNVSGHSLLGTYNPEAEAILSVAGNCYTGEHSVVLTEILHLVDCGTACAGLSKCSGINYRRNVKQCDLVYEITDSNPHLMGTVDGCKFWSVLHN